jgi:hypothetical protein
MPATVEKLPDEPIILVTIDGHLDVAIARQIYAEIAELAQDIEGKVYRITDLRKQTSSFMDTIGVVKEAAKGSPGTTSDPRITNVFVGHGKVAPTTLNLMRQKNPESHGVLETVEDALEYVRWQIQLDNQTTSRFSGSCNPQFLNLSRRIFLIKMHPQSAHHFSIRAPDAILDSG